MVKLHEVLHIFLGSVSTLTIQSCYLDPSKYFIKAIGIQDQSPSHTHLLPHCHQFGTHIPQPTMEPGIIFALKFFYFELDKYSCSCKWQAIDRILRLYTIAVIAKALVEIKRNWVHSSNAYNIHKTIHKYIA